MPFIMRNKIWVASSVILLNFCLSQTGSSTICESMQRLGFIRYLFTIFVGLHSLTAISQECTPTTTIKAVLCPNRDSTCKACPYHSGYDYHGGLAACDSNYRIVEFTIVLQKKDWKSDEVNVKGNVWSVNATALLNKALLGDTVLFFCIKGQNKQKQIFILPPLTIHL